MLKCDGYKMFHGTVLITPVIRSNGTRSREPFELTGTWLFKPEWQIGQKDGCWYCKPDNGGFVESYSPDILSDFRDDCSEESCR